MFFRGDRLKNFCEDLFFFGDRLKNFCEDLFFFWRALALVSFGPWPRAFLSLASRVSVLGKAVLGLGFFCVLGLGLGLEPCVLDSTSGNLHFFLFTSETRNETIELIVRKNLLVWWLFCALEVTFYSLM